MGMFSSKRGGGAAPSQPVRRDKVRAVLKAYMEETDAGDGPDAGGAAQRLSQACKGASQAEIRAAHAAAKRHGYR